MGVTLLNTHASSVCSGTRDCTKRMQRSGSSPAAMLTMAAWRILSCMVETS